MPKSIKRPDDPRVPLATLKKLGYRAGVPRIGEKALLEVNDVVNSFMNELVKNAVIFMQHYRRATLQEHDVQEALRIIGMPAVYGEMGDMEVPKRKRSASKKASKSPAKKASKSPASRKASGSKRKVRPGIVALRAVRRYQKSTDPILTLANIKEKIATRVADMQSRFRISADAVLLVREALEAHIISTLEKALVLAIHAGRRTVQESDVALARRVCNLGQK